MVGRRQGRRREVRRKRDPQPEGWTLLNYLMDPRTGLGRFREFRISNYELMMQLIDPASIAASMRSSSIRTSKERVDALPRARRRQRSRSCAARRCTDTSSCSTSARRRSSTRPIASWSTRCCPQCTISVHVIWGVQPAEHRVRGRAVDHRPLVDINVGAADALLRWRRPRGGRDLPDRQRSRRDILAEIVSTIDVAEREPATA